MPYRDDTFAGPVPAEVRPAAGGPEANAQAAGDPVADTHDILGVAVWPASADTARDRLYRSIARKRGTAVAFLNAHAANIAYESPEFRRTLDRFLVLPDGLGVDIASLILHGRPFPENLNGTDFVPALLREAPEGFKVALLGGREGVAEAAARALSRIAPQHDYRVAGHGYFDWDDPSVHLRIAELRPDILLVALGNPRQEQWIAHRLEPGAACLAIGVGALFDFLAGEVPRAPRLLRMARMEWLFRLAIEPRRMFRRYVIGNPLFLCRALRARRAGQVRGNARRYGRRDQRRRNSNP